MSHTAYDDAMANRKYNPPSFSGAEVNPAPYGYFPGTRIPRKAPPTELHAKPNTCKYCGADIIWEQHGDKWRPTEIGGKRHVCPPKDEFA